MDDLHRAVFVSLSIANIPPQSWNCQIFANHISHTGSVTQHQSRLPSGGVATLAFGITDNGVAHTITGTCNIANGNTTFTVNGGADLPHPVPSRFPQIDAGFEAAGSQIWFRYDDQGTLREYRMHTQTNLNFLANVLHINGFSPLAQIISAFIGL